MYTFLFKNRTYMLPQKPNKGKPLREKLYKKIDKKMENFVRVMYNEKNGKGERLMKYVFGVDLGGTTVKMACFEENGNCLEKWEIPTVTADNGKRILPDIARAVEDCVARLGIEKSQVLGLGIGVPGPVSDAGLVNKCINLGWGVFNIQEELSRLTGLPVKAGNDATVAALGECVHGGGKGAKNMVLVTLGTGVGGGVVIDGKIVSGAHGAAGEIGHLVLNPHEEENCNCGKKGCAEQYCSATGIVRLAKQHLQKTDAPSPLRKENLTCKDIFDAKDDNLAKEVLAEFFDYLAMLIANICNTVNPETVVIGGGVSKAGDFLLDGIRAYFPKYVFHAAAGVSFAPAKLHNDAGIYGAFELIGKDA